MIGQLIKFALLAFLAGLCFEEAGAPRFSLLVPRLPHPDALFALLGLVLAGWAAWTALCALPALARTLLALSALLAIGAGVMYLLTGEVPYAHVIEPYVDAELLAVLAPLLAAALALLAGLWLFARLTYRFIDRYLQSRLAQREARKGHFGDARWAALGDIEASGLTGPGGLVLGALGPHRLAKHGEGHVLTIAPPGAGKSSALVIPTLLGYHDGASVVVTDPKGELTIKTAPVRAAHSRVVVLNPWSEDVRRGLEADEGLRGIELPDSGFNPMSFLKPGPDLRTNANLLSALLIPDPPSGSDPFWTTSARNLVTGLLVYLVTQEAPSARNLVRLYSLLRRPRQLEIALRAMAADGNEAQQAAGEQCLGYIKDSPAQWTGTLGHAHTCTEIYAPGDPLGDHVMRDGLDVDALKREALSLYVVIPPRRILSHKAWLNLVLAIVCEAVGKPGPAREVTLVMDEFATLGYLPNLLSAMAQYRSAGLRAWILNQTLGQLRRIYGRDAVDDFMGQCSTKQFFQVQDGVLAKEISEMAGKRTVVNRSTGELSQTASASGVALVTPEQVRGLGRDEQIIIHKNLYPIRAWLQPYFLVDDQRAVVAASIEALRAGNGLAIEPVSQLALEARSGEDEARKPPRLPGTVGATRD